MQRYRSGHNEAVLKTVWVHARVGSNPTLCAKKWRFLNDFESWTKYLKTSKTPYFRAFLLFIRELYIFSIFFEIRCYCKSTANLQWLFFHFFEQARTLLDLFFIKRESIYDYVKCIETPLATNFLNVIQSI